MPVTTAVTIAIEDPRNDEVRGLIGELNDALLALTPPEFCWHMSVEEMAGPETTVWIARLDGVAIACGALRRHEGGLGEVKRMYTKPDAQGQGIGGQILERIEARARQDGIARLVLETGDRHPAAWRVYERAGFKRCGPVLDYPDSKWSVFYEKGLATREPVPA